ncbi:BGTF surface domain-containing protein [Halorussus halobius]|uniref:BGTF surface domain-containing protein n=1 Tax=Halorussus halobius TaxID=1710537 RepID=UPI0010928A5A|nr:BGTF surface domain-containing protein [Halorussus halobius]
MLRSRTPVVALAVVAAVLATTSVAAAAPATPLAEPTTGDPVADAADAASALSGTASQWSNNTTIVSDGDEPTLQSAPDQTIRGETSVDPDTEVVVVLEGPTFYKSATTTVTDRGTFAASFDLSSLSSGVTVGVSAKTDPANGSGTKLVATTGYIGCDDDDCRSDAGDGETTVDANATDVQSITEVTQGRVASIDVSFGDADALTVSIGGPSVNYVVNGTVHDEDGDGRATVLFYTGRAGTDAPTLGVLDAGQRRVVEASAETSLDSPLAPTVYEVSLHPGTDATGDVASRGQVVVFEEAQSSAASANASIVTEGGELVLQPETNQTIRGETDLEPGTEVSVNVEGERFLTTSVATIAEDGTFESTVDLSGQEGERLEVSVRHDDATLAAAEGRVACAGDCETPTDAEDGSGSDATTVTTDVSNPDPGTPSTDDSGSQFLDGVGMIALGGVLAVAGIGVVLGLFRN